MVWIGGALAAVVVVALLARRLRRRLPQRGPRHSRPQDEVNADGSGRFHALSLRFGAGACDSSRRLHGKRFLSPDAPTLPLADCDTEHCRCRYVHHRDRRDGEDRRSPFQSGFGGSATRMERNRRRSTERRSRERVQKS